MNDPILSLLQHPDPKQRKRGISAAAKRADPRYLKPLARLVRADEDPAVREMAKKAGTYIHKQAKAAEKPAPQPAAKPTPAPIALPNPADLTALPDREPDPDQAEIHYNEAFDLHLKGKNAHAALELASAFYLNPAYAQDPTAVAFAAEMTQRPGPEAVQFISDPHNWQSLTDDLGGLKQSTTTEQQPGRSDTQTFYLWLAAAVVLVVLVGLVVNFLGTDMFAAVFQQSLSNVTNGGIGGEAPIPTPTPIPQ